MESRVTKFTEPARQCRTVIHTRNSRLSSPRSRQTTAKHAARRPKTYSLRPFPRIMAATQALSQVPSGSAPSPARRPTASALRGGTKATAARPERGRMKRKHKKGNCLRQKNQFLAVPGSRASSCAAALRRLFASSLLHRTSAASRTSWASRRCPSPGLGLWVLGFLGF